MNEQEKLQMENYMNQMNQALESEQLKNAELQNAYTKDSAFSPINSPSILEYQLDSNKLLDKAYHLLSGHILKNTPQGEVWADPEDDRLKIFSSYGVERIMNLLSFYITPEVVLSIFDLETINREVREFGIELADLIQNRYELIFSYPKPEELFDKIKPIALKKGMDVSDEELYFKCLEWSSNELRLKLANYPIITQSLISLVHANYRRAFNGETLKSLRTITHISQSLNTQPQQVMPSLQQRKGIFSWGKS